MYIYLPTDIPDTPSDFQEVHKSCDTDNCTYILEWSSPSLYEFYLIVDGHSITVPPGKMYYIYQRSRQENANISVVAKNVCGLQSKMSNSVLIYGKIVN